MINYKKNCTVCKQIKKTSKLADDIYKTTAYDKTSKVSLKNISDIYKLSYDSVRNHVKKHQGLSAEDLSQRHLNNIVKKAEKELVKKKLESRDVWNTIMDLGHEQIQSGDIKLKASDVTRAAKDKSDYELKVKDQELAMIEMVYHFASGESNEGRIHANATRTDAEKQAEPDNNLAERITESTQAGENGSSSVHYPPTWDAATFGTSKVSEGNN